MVKGVLALMLLAGATGVTAAQTRAPIYDRVRLNIGINCRWEQRCMAVQQHAMNAALSFVRVERPNTTRIHLCNRNASRGRSHMDWVGFNNCIRNASLRRRFGQLRVIKASLVRA